MTAYTVTFTNSRRPIAPLDVESEGIWGLRRAIFDHVWPSIMSADVEVLLNEFSGSGRVVSGSRTVALFTVDAVVLDGAA